MYNRDKEVKLKYFKAIAEVHYLRGRIRWNDARQKYIATGKTSGKDLYRACGDFYWASKMGHRRATSLYKKSACKEFER